ncbi:uncharacterized protein F4812DRAFT_419639 [Daldinia caldariorum]|uniref:uncharacterized protein n=1 Tax=Daldinia caldariorum TaxID=326644 RepID=UPI002008AAA6|nr:uncharacterized protein F4812DRAFT_419639 [Daldinia caldariorum]KAI1470961.1 hypothetical protein F4812DRAFT_419639 [Daldinia caldariorum]
MDSAPLIKAHDHARAASLATHASDTTVAVNEHTRAAGEFANAARNTSSVEALRTLKLLEQHHRRLSELLQLPSKPLSSQAASENDSQASEKDEGATSVASSSPPTNNNSTETSNEKNAQPLPTLPKQPRYPPRDLGASIASNLASARGIRSKYRSQPLSPSVSNTEAPGNMEGASRRSGSKTKMQNMLDNSDRPSNANSPEKGRLSRQSSSGLEDDVSNQERVDNKQANTSDDGFSRFYSAFGSIINKISAPLAFAGLPLINEEQPEASVPAPAPTPDPPVQKRTRVRGPSSVSTEPDLRKYYSKAALRAVSRDGQSANDSFYVVPTSGHTASYASILSFADKEKRRLVAQGSAGVLLEDPDEDDFVDARESQAARGPPAHRLAGKRSDRDRDRDMANMVDELYLENKGLKDMLDKLSKRLHAFESMSQNSGMRLAESMRLMRPGSPLAGKASAPVSSTTTTATAALSTGTGTGILNAGISDEQLAKRNRELEEQLQAMAKQMEETERNYNKARANLVRYREKWEQLKAGAKARRAGQGGSGSGSAVGQGGSEAGIGLGVDDGFRSPGLG